jgi:hypothetical protein
MNDSAQYDEQKSRLSFISCEILAIDNDSLLSRFFKKKEKDISLDSADYDFKEKSNSIDSKDIEEEIEKASSSSLNECPSNSNSNPNINQQYSPEKEQQFLSDILSPLSTTFNITSAGYYSKVLDNLYQ